ncbi:MAG: hotdog domain-containing protein [Acidimicrobiales bacterium]
MADRTGYRPDPRRVVGDYFRLERWEIPPPDGVDAPSEFGGRIPVDPHQRGHAGGIVTGGLLSSLDNLGGFTAGIAVLPEWVVTTSMMVTFADLSHRGPLRLHARVLRRGRKAVVTGIDVVDEGADDRAVAVATMTCSVLDPGTRDLEFERPFSIPMAPPDPLARPPLEFFAIEPGTGPITRLRLEEHLRNPWGILHGGAVAMLADVGACRAVEASREGGSEGRVAAGDTVLHYLFPARVGPVEARCEVLGSSDGRSLVRVAIHDVGAEDRLVTVGSITVVPV